MKRTVIRLPDWLHAALTQKGRQEGASLNQTMVATLEAAILTAHIDEYLADIWLGAITCYCLIRSGERYAFVWGADTFPTEEGMVPAVNVELADEGIMWFTTVEGARGAAAEAFAALEQQGEDVTDLREAFGLSVGLE
jgi:hypothetical protein